jgi:hypothetical protein
MTAAVPESAQRIGAAQQRGGSRLPKSRDIYRAKKALGCTGCCACRARISQQGARRLGSASLLEAFISL